MDGKMDRLKKTAKQIFSEYLGMYIEDAPSTPREIAEALPRYLQRGLKLAAWCLIGYYFGSTPVAYSSIPFGTALLASVRSNVFFVYLGLLISAALNTSGMALPLFLIYTALFIARILCYRTFGGGDRPFSLFGEGLKYRLIESFSASLLISAYRAALYGFLYYDIIGGAFEIAAVPILTYLYGLAFDPRHRYGIKREWGILALLCSFVVASSRVYLLGFSLGIMSVCVITLYISKKAGVMRGGAYGMLCGFVCSPVLCPVFSLMGMASGALWKKGIGTALFAAGAVGIAGGIYVEGWDSLMLFVPEITSAVVLFFPFAAFGWLPKIYIYGDELTESDGGEEAMLMLAEKRQRDTEERFERLSAAFSELSEVFYKLSDRARRPGTIDTKEICDKACDKYCLKCIFRRVCWEREYTSTYDVFSKLSKTLCDRGFVEKSAVEPFLRDRCRNIDRMLEYINEQHAELLENMINRNKTEVFAMDYEAMAHLLESAVRLNCEDYSPDGETGREMQKALRRLGVRAKSVCVFGKRKRSVIVGGVDAGTLKLSVDSLKEYCENLCGAYLTQPCFEVDGDCVTVTMQSARRFKVEYAASTVTKRNERLCGDMICMFENGHDYFYSLISDGMGSGREAAMTSRLCGLFLKKMLEAGNSKPVAIEMLNNFIRSKNTECFSTLDLLEVDLLNGKAGFIKGGAVASYVARGDKIFKISSNTMPVGITREINAEEVTFELEEGDVIVMVSDGVGNSDAFTAKMSDVLNYTPDNDLQKMADKLVNGAWEDSGGIDDVSVGIIRIKPN